MAAQMMTLLAIDRDDYGMKLVVNDYESQPGGTWNDDNWLSCTATIQFGLWNSEFRFSCFTTDIAEFGRELARFKNDGSSIAQFTPLEPEIQLKLASAHKDDSVLQLISNWHSSRNGELRSELSLKLPLDSVDVESLTDQVLSCAKMFVER